LFDLRRNEEAKLELETAAKVDPRNTAVLYLLAVAEKQLDQPARSAELLERVIALEPGNADAQFLLGQVLAKLGRESDAIVRWKKTVQLNTDHAEALYSLVRHLNKAEPEEARKYQARFAELQTRKRITERADTLGNFALAAAGARDWNQAVAQLEEAVEVCGNCRSKADLHKNLGLIYCRSGNLEKGERELRTAQNLKASDPDITKSLRIIDELKNRKSQP
jgi:tetratricopeptide (TPR) repeat protein